MKGLACHRMVEVHLYGIFRHFHDFSRYYGTHAVHHRYRIARHEEIFAYLSVYFKCSLWKIDDPFRFYFSVSVCRRQCHVKSASGFHSLYMCLQFWQQIAGSMYIVKRFLFCRVVDNLSVDLEFVAEFHYSVLCYFHFICCLKFVTYVSTQRMTHPQRLMWGSAISRLVWHLYRLPEDCSIIP